MNEIKTWIFQDSIKNKNHTVSCNKSGLCCCFNGCFKWLVNISGPMKPNTTSHTGIVSERSLTTFLAFFLVFCLSGFKEEGGPLYEGAVSFSTFVAGL
jgi:hypothetical protein